MGAMKEKMKHKRQYKTKWWQHLIVTYLL